MLAAIAQNNEILVGNERIHFLCLANFGSAVQKKNPKKMQKTQKTRKKRNSHVFLRLKANCSEESRMSGA